MTIRPSPTTEAAALSAEAQAWAVLRDAFERAPLAVACTEGPEHRLRYTNPAWRDLFGAAGTDAPAPGVRAALAGRIDPVAFTLLDDVLATAEPAQASDLPLPGGAEPAWCDLVCSPWQAMHNPFGAADGPGVGGLLVGAILTTRRVRVQQDLEQAAAQLHAEQRRLALLQRATAAMAAADDAGDVLQAVRSAAQDCLDSSTAAVALLAEDGGLAFLHDTVGTRLDERWRVLAPHAPTISAHVARTRKPVFVPTVAAMRELVPGPQTEAFLAAQSTFDGERSWAGLPLLTSSALLGVLRVAWPQERVLGASDRGFLEALAAQSALALERLRARDVDRMSASQLQRSLLPPQPVVPGLDIAVRYVPGADGMLVGGDWYDVVPRPSGEIVVTVGDVMGRGARAAATMSQLRPALAASAELGVAPAASLALLDTLIQRTDPDAIATATLVILDPVDGRLTIANAGHLVPVIVGADGIGGPVVAPPGPPLGVSGERPVVELMLPRGATLALFTDGLVEHRRQDIDQGLQALTAVLAEERDLPLEQLADAVLVALGRAHGHDDDVALLLLRRDRRAKSRRRPEPAGTFLQLRLPADPASVREARHAAEAACRAAGKDEKCDVVALLVSEVATNAIVHPASRQTGPSKARYVEVLVDARGPQVRVEVADADPARPVIRHSGNRDESGRGLLLVEQLAQSWGVTERAGGGKTVWFEVA